MSSRASLRLLLAPARPRAIGCRPRAPGTPGRRRPFITLPNAGPQVLTAKRVLPYQHARLYDLIADVDSYSQFVPYCKEARVTQWSAPAAADGRRWPTRADLTAGWGGLEETYTSRLFCVPGSVVEAISGDAATEIPGSVLRELGLTDPGPLPSRGEHAVFKSLVTRWTVRPFDDKTRADRSHHEWSEVDLSIKFQFANPLYAAISSAVADKVASIMIEAFVKQARSVLGKPGGELDR